jgi:hypothetical protein
MLRRVLVAGALGCLALFVWAFVANAFFEVGPRVKMNRVLDERQVHAVLTANVARPGVYLVNPALTEDGQFPDHQPVFSVSYAGFGHEAAFRMMFVELAFWFAAALLTAGLLSQASPRILAHYFLRVLFIGLLGVLLALVGELGRFGIGGYPFGSVLPLAVNTALSWTFAGLVMAWPVRPVPAPARR